MSANFTGQRTTDPSGQKNVMPNGPDNLYFPWKYAHPEDSWVCIPDPEWTPPVDDKGKPVKPPKTNAADLQACKLWGCSPGQPWVWIPRLKTFRFQPGINGVRLGKKGGGKPQTRQAVAAAAEDHGLHLIPWDAYPGGYLMEYVTGRGEPKKVVYADVWTEITVVKGRRGGLQTHHKFNGRTCPAHAEDGITWNVWRKELVTKGVVSAPTVIGLDIAEEVQKQRAGKNVKHEATNPAYASQGNKERYKLRMMREATARIAGPAVPIARRTRAVDGQEVA